MSYVQSTKPARQVLSQAHAAARRLNHNYVGTEHVLLALLAEPSGVIAQLLTALGTSSEQASARIEPLVQPGIEGGRPRDMEMTPGMKRFLRESLVTTVQHGDRKQGIPHMIIGLARAEDSVSAELLESIDISLADLREQAEGLLRKQGKAGWHWPWQRRR